ncbi:HlyD family type I secretion periplasmic adaptor subunit [Thioalkalivibrio sp. ALJ24]|uniref:HlyD family type I secretion periplasmic adaptor subunit n=1 Tax=Thioalkalivibrio sp. ALJ24 TaxID=545276 RepID=UPI00037B2C13|nr:HlyD family type I secretion periplasmic adaptor subunit [Thioalkalivibrio sp. ALJ24]
MAGSDRRSAEQKGFEAVGRASGRGSRPLRPLVERLFGGHARQVSLERDWENDAEWARVQQEPVRARRFLYLVLAVFAALAVWSYFAMIDEVTRGTGQVIPSSQLQRIQNPDGGVVQEIMVREGQRVEAGEVLMRIDPTRFVADFRENRTQSLALEARAARLRALIREEPFQPSEELLREAPGIVAEERDAYDSRREELREQRQALQEQLMQRREELREAESRHSTAGREVSMASQELELTRPLLESGAVSEMEILRLEREVSVARGEREQAGAAVSRLEAAVEEAETRLRELGAERRAQWRDDLVQVTSDKQALDESGAGLADRVHLTEVRAPVDGIVQRLHVTTIGGVAQAGHDLVEIVPVDDQLLVEARIAPQDIAFLHPGQEATIKLTAYDFNIFGGLDAEIEHISADTITDDDGESFYLVRFRTREEVDGRMEVIPGMTADVDVRTGERTVMQFLLKPLLRAWSDSLGER